jgi:hypothetical protein
MVWNSRELEELSAQFQATLDESGLEGVRGTASAFGEDWYEGNSDDEKDREPCYFAILEIDFYVTLRTESLVDAEALGASMEKVLTALADFPPEATPGSQPGFLDVTFVAGEKHEMLRLPIPEALEARERGLTGAALMEALSSAPEVPGFEPGCEANQNLFVTADGAEHRAVVTSYRCEEATIDSTGQSPADPPDVRLSAGEGLAFRLGTTMPPDRLELRIYPGAGIAASFFRWPEELPLEIEPVEQMELEPALGFEYQPETLAGAYSLVIRATWGEDIDVFYALSFEVQ